MAKSKIEQILSGREDERIDVDHILSRFPWLMTRKQKCILSPDSDGLLCGLFMSHYLDWEVVGYYDGKVLLLKDGLSTYDDDVVFLDIELYRKHVKSVGHHMLLFNKRVVPDDWGNFDNCLQPNILRNLDGKNYFRMKYPLATIHLLLSIIGTRIHVPVTVDTIAPLFFVDGTFNVLYGYPENVLNWLDYLRVDSSNNPLRDIFLHDHFTVYGQMKVMRDFFRRRDELTVEKQRGDKFVISTKTGDFSDNVIHQIGNLYCIEEDAKKRLISFLSILSEHTGWLLNESKWTLSDLKRYKFSKSNFQEKGWTLTNKNYNSFMEQNPLSWAMTSSMNIEFTLETPDVLP